MVVKNMFNSVTVFQPLISQEQIVSKEDIEASSSFIPSPQVLVAWPHYPSGVQSFVDSRTHGFLASEVCILMRSTLMYSLEAGRGINRILGGFAGASMPRRRTLP